MSLAAQFSKFAYRYGCKPYFFKRDPETVHDRMVRLGATIGKCAITRSVTQQLFAFGHPMLEQRLHEIFFKNPVGLSAGFDKNADLTSIMPSVGFGFEEVGSITAGAYEGNPKPRLWRMPEHRALQVYYGLKNDGAEKIHKKLMGKKFHFPLGVSIAKTNCPETSQLEKGIKDYLFTYTLFQDVGDYFTINISCPNTCETTPLFANPQNLSKLLKTLQTIPKKKPLFIKLSPDLEDRTLIQIIESCLENDVDGFVCTNLTKNSGLSLPGKGGVSGKAVEMLANKMIRTVYSQTKGKKTIIGCGGIFTPEDAYAKIRAGANLLQLITGMIYEGPQLIGDINRGLVALLKRDGFTHVSEAVGAGK